MSQQTRYQIVHLHPNTPPKPALGAVCNGCGVCCASEPCPIGMLVTRRRSGRCAALLWREESARYVCGLLAEPQRFSGVRWKIANRLLRSIAARSIAAGIGCDAQGEVVG